MTPTVSIEQAAEALGCGGEQVHHGDGQVPLARRGSRDPLEYGGDIEKRQVRGTEDVDDGVEGIGMIERLDGKRRDVIDRYVDLLTTVQTRSWATMPSRTARASARSPSVTTQSSLRLRPRVAAT